ncbi:MAG TPA: capsule assembly Wzi family protein [Candidatus Binataceae bacterium]|nr:capsule assembly Wzi family protein [Candidatus Binataceae bacterium]
MKGSRHLRRYSGHALLVSIAIAVALMVGVRLAQASTYVVYIPLDSPIYNELDTLNGLGLLYSYLDDIKPISRVEAARLVLEAQRQFELHEQGEDGVEDDELARPILHSLQAQLHEEIGWLENRRENNLPNLFHPVGRIELQYVYTHGEARQAHINQLDGSNMNFDEGTPLLPNNNGLPTSPGSNEVARVSSWGGFGSFLTLYGEGAVAGPFTRPVSGGAGSDLRRLQPLDAEAVASLGNVAISFGQEEMWWGVGHFAALSQSNNANPFPALRVQGIHPTHLPWVFKYLGLFRWNAFFGQLDDDRTFAHPWIDGQNFSFKPLPDFEFGLTHAIEFGGVNNNNYNLSGFVGRATGFATGNPAQGNTNSRGGIYMKLFVPHWRNSQFYFEMLGEDNLTKEVPFIGSALPFKAISYQGGFYLPRLTRDGLTDFRFEWAILEPNYSQHSDSLYWTNNDRLMGDPMGPNASQIDIDFGRWFMKRCKADLDLFVTERAPFWNPQVNLHKERSVGGALNLWTIPGPMPGTAGWLGDVKARSAFEYVNDINFSDSGSMRATLMLSFAIRPGWKSIEY